FEKCTGYIRLHGFAVAQGMVAAFRLARRLDMCEGSDEERLRVVLHNCGLPASWGGDGLEGNEAIERVWQAMGADKKRRGGGVRFVLPEAIGKVTLVDSIPE